jgi:hypothetical protein
MQRRDLVFDVDMQHHSGVLPVRAAGQSAGITSGCIIGALSSSPGQLRAITEPGIAGASTDSTPARAAAVPGAYRRARRLVVV